LNYAVSLVDDHAGVINQATLTITAKTNSKVYDGTTSAAATPEVSGLQGSDTVTGLAETYGDKNVGTGKTLSVSAYTVNDGNSGGNYAVSLVADTTGEITKRSLTVSGLAADNKVYDGTTAATLNFGSAVLQNVAAGDELLVSLDTTAAAGTFVTRNVGTAIEVDVSGLGFAGGAAGNYSIVQPTTSADITVRTLTITAQTNSKVYDTTTSASATPLFSGLQTGDSLTGLTEAYADKVAGTGKTLSVTGFTLSDGNNGDNYHVITVDDTTGVITRYSLTVTGITAANKVYNGDTDATIDTTNAVLVGVLGTDAVTLDTSAAVGTFDNKNVGTGKTVTINGLLTGGLDGGNYQITPPTTTADITRLAITGNITANNKQFDGTTSATIATRTLTGAVAGDAVSLVGGSATFDNRNVGNNKLVTAINLSLSGGDAGNYQLSSTTATTTANITPTSVVTRGLFYKGSSFDHSQGDPGNYASAIAPDKVALLPGQTAGFANISSYSLGINGVVIDLAGNITQLGFSDFTFKVGNDNNPSGWSAAPPPSSMYVFPGQGPGGSTRVEFVWGDNVIQKEWLQVQIVSGLNTPDVFYFGNAIGESGDTSADAKVTIVDALGARSNPSTNAQNNNVFDFNRDGNVDGTDVTIAAQNLTNVFNSLALITPPTGSFSSSSSVAEFVMPGGTSTPGSTSGNTDTSTPATSTPDVTTPVTTDSVAPTVPAVTLPTAPPITVPPVATPPSVTPPTAVPPPVTPPITVPPVVTSPATLPTSVPPLTTPVTKPVTPPVTPPPATPAIPAIPANPGSSSGPATPAVPAKPAVPPVNIPATPKAPAAVKPANVVKTAASSTGVNAAVNATSKNASQTAKLTLARLFANALQKLGLLRRP
jgi:hypothetical protein